MSLETAKKAIDFLIANSGDRRVLETDFFGGEPLMNFDVVKETVYYAKAEAAKRGKEFRFTLTTNGLLLKDNRYTYSDFLNREMDNVVLSLDGRKEVHDAVRKTANGKGSFDLVIENLKNFVRIRGDKSYYVRGTFTAKNLDFAKDVLFLADSGFDSISLEPVVTDIADLAIGKEHLPRIGEEYDRLCDAYLARLAAGKGFSFFHFNVDLEGGPCLAKRVSACAPATNIFRSFPTAIFIPAINSRATAIFAWAACTRGLWTPQFGKSSAIPVCSPGKNAVPVSPNTFAAEGAAPTTIISTAASTSRMRSPVP